MLHNRKEVKDAASMLESYTSEGRPAQFYQEVGTLLESGEINPESCSIRELFEAFVSDGSELVENMNPRNRVNSVLLEAGDAVDTSRFSNIIGQITYSTTMAKLDGPEFIGRSLHKTVSSKTQEQEIIPGVSMIGDVAEDVGEGKAYPRVGVSEEWVTIPRKIKDGWILEITEEAIFEDKTGLLLQRSNAATESLGITWEKELLDNALGITTSYSRNGGAAQATYGDTHTQGTFDNLAASNGLVDYTDIEAATNLFDDITDPNTGEPVYLSGTLQIVVPTDLELTLLSILNATEISTGDTTSATVPVTMARNPLQAQNRRTYVPVTSQYVSARTSSATTWFIGDFTGAFQYHENWPIQVFRMDRNSQEGFNRDVVTAIKVRRKGVPAVVEPRKVIKCTA